MRQPEIEHISPLWINTGELNLRDSTILVFNKTIRSRRRKRKFRMRFHAVTVSALDPSTFISSESDGELY